MAPVSNLVAALSVVAGLYGTLTAAHPGERHDARAIAREMKRTINIAEQQHGDLAACYNQPHVREMHKRAIERRAATAQRLREERGIAEEEPFIHRRNLNDFKSWANEKHNMTGTSGIDLNTPPGSLFGANPKCVLTPDNANGPYFVWGEQVRSNLVENQVGVPMHLEMQFLDVKTCKPATEVLVDVWSCNATGVYSGISAAGQGGLSSSWLRGVQKTSADGVVNFDTLFPGHYSGRATHEHIITHVGAKLEANGSYTGGKINHLSQLFFDQALITEVEKTAPYNTNKIALTTNVQDGFTGYAASKAYDPFPEYMYLGNDIKKGLFVWALVGIDLTADVGAYATNNAYVDEKGGHDNPAFNWFVVATPPSTHGKRDETEESVESEVLEG